MKMEQDEEDLLISHAKSRLAAKYPSISDEDIEATLAAAYARFAGRRVRDFVPLLVERKAGERLADFATEQHERAESLWSERQLAERRKMDSAPAGGSGHS